MAIDKSVISLRGLKAVNNGALSAAALPARIKILDWGTSQSTQGPVTLDEVSAQVFSQAQKSIGRESIALDFEHNTVPGTDAYKESAEPRPVAAYGTPKIYSGDGLWLENLEWTPAGQSGAKNFKDISPAPFLVDGRVIGLHSSALTRNGSIADLQFYSTGGVETDLTRLAALCLPEPKLPENFPPIATRENVVSALAFINQARNLAAYSAGELAVIKTKLGEAITKHGVPTTLSASGLPVYDSSKPFVQPTNLMIEHIKTLRAAYKLPDTTTDADVLKAAADAATKPVIAPTPVPVAPDLAALTASVTESLKGLITPLSAKVEALNTELANNATAADERERARLITLAGSQGKVIPLDEAVLKTLSTAALAQMVEKLPANKVPMAAKARTFKAANGEVPKTALEKALHRPAAFSADGLTGLDRTAALFQAQVEALQAN